MKKIIIAIVILLSVLNIQAQTISITCETCQWLKTSDCDVCGTVYKAKMFRGGLKIKKLGKTMYFEHPLSIELVNSKFKMTDANGQKLDFYLNETSFNSIGALKSFIALCACSSQPDTSNTPSITDTDRRLTNVVFQNDSIVFTIKDINNNTVSTLYLDNGKPTNNPCKDSVWKVADTLFHKNVLCNIQKVTLSSSKATEFHTLTSLSDTSTFTASAQTNCPSLTVARLDSCNISYLYMFNCNTNAWELFKTPNIYTAGKTLFVDEIAGNDATAKKGCPTCAFKTIDIAASNYSDRDNIFVNAGDYFISAGALEGKKTAFITLNNSAKITGGYGSIGHSSSSATTLDTVRILGAGSITNNGGWAFVSQFGKKKQLLIDVSEYNSGSPIYDGQTEKVIINAKQVNMTGSGVFVYHSATSNTDVSINVDNLFSRKNGAGDWQPGFIHTASEYGGQTIFEGYENNNLAINLKNVRWERHSGSLLYAYGNNTGGQLYKNNRQSFTVDNLLQYNIDSTTFGYSVGVTGGWNSAFSFGKDASTFDIVNDDTKLLFKNSITDYRLVDFDQNQNYTNCNFTLKGDNCLVKKLETVLSGANNVFTNCEIIVDGVYSNISGAPLISFINTTFINSKIILKGNFTSKGKIVEVNGGSFDVNSSITLEGTFKTTSTTLPAIDINHNRLILDKASIITGGGYSVDSSAPISIIVKPGTSSNVATSSNVTQLGTGIYVDPNFNN